MSACGRANPRPVWRCAPLQCLCRLGDMRANPRATPCHQQPPSLGTVTDRGPHRSVDRAPGVCQALHQAQESGHRQITQESDLARKIFFPGLSTRGEAPVCPDFPSDWGRAGLPWPSLGSEARIRVDSTAEGGRFSPHPSCCRWGKETPGGRVRHHIPSQSQDRYSPGTGLPIL